MARRIWAVGLLGWAAATLAGCGPSPIGPSPITENPAAAPPHRTPAPPAVAARSSLPDAGECQRVPPTSTGCGR
jgi:hypothetical protein